MCWILIKRSEVDSRVSTDPALRESEQSQIHTVISNGGKEKKPVELKQILDRGINLLHSKGFAAVD